MTRHTKEKLLQYAVKYERAFPSPDPSEFLKTAEDANNQEATAFVAACLSFGSIEQFMPKIGWLVEWANDSGGMDSWIRRGTFKRKVRPDACRCFYRFVTYADLHAFLHAYQLIMREHGTLGEYVRGNG